MSRFRYGFAGCAILALTVAAPALAQSADRGSVIDQDQPVPSVDDGPAQPTARTTVVPYIEVGQLLDADLNSGDVVTYTSVAVGVDAAIQTRRAEAQVSYRYNHQFSWDDLVGDQDIHSGLFRGAYRITPALSIDGGAIATRARADIRGAAPGTLVGDDANVSQVYSLYAGPNYSNRFGPVAVDAAYHIGYSKVTTPGGGGLFGQPRLDYFDDATNHLATLRVGTQPGTVLPVGLTASAAYEREDAGQLNQRYEGWYGRGDALLPVSPTLALAAGVGYERIETSQQSALVDTAGAPVLDGNGRFVTDPGSDQRVAYHTDGVYYDAGVVWRPNRRAEVQARVGERYGSLSVTGSATYQASRNVGFAMGVYDGVQTFGRQLRTGLAGLPTSFVANRDALNQQYTGCVFGNTGAAPGGCLNDVFQSISTATYRARGIDGVMSITRGLNVFGVGAGYANREIYAPDTAPGVVISGLEDQSWYGQIFYSRTLSPESGFNANGFVNYYDTGFAGADTTLSLGATGSYFRYFGRLITTATVGLYHFKVGDFASDLTAQAQVGARYQF